MNQKQWHEHIQQVERQQAAEVERLLDYQRQIIRGLTEQMLVAEPTPDFKVSRFIINNDCVPCDTYHLAA
jgi:hypothetical protein